VLQRSARATHADLLAIGTVTDAYQPIRREPRLMRGVFGSYQRHAPPLAIVWGSDW
jgi:DNA repair photolyase